MCDLEHCTAQEQLLNMAMDIQLIKTALLGNEFNQNKGLIHKIDRVENRQRDLELQVTTKLRTQEQDLEKMRQKWNYRIGFAAGIGATVGIALSIIFKFI